MKLAIIQVRGTIGLSAKLKETLRLLKLPKNHSCVIVEPNPSTRGMLIALKDYVTWGEIDYDTLKLLLQKRARLAGGKPLTEPYLHEKTSMDFDTFSKALFEGKIRMKDVPGAKPYFRLTPPIHGFERGGIKVPYSMGGVLGYRKNHINDLLRRMI